MRLGLAALVSTVALAVAAQGAAAFDRLFLYLPDSELQKRVLDQGQFLGYVRSTKQALVQVLASDPNEEAISLGVIVAIRGSGETKTWFNVQSGDMSLTQRVRIAEAIEIIPAPEVRGIVPFALGVRAWGAPDPVTVLPIAPEWREHLDGKEITAAIEEAWN